MESIDAALRLIAFYLPQFHPVPENDRWWGEGYTEWHALRRARPSFAGHAMPRLPTGPLGFYDLRDPAVPEAQAALARAHGVHGFCYYHYWFAGRGFLDAPLAAIARSGRPAFPYCLCWANESLTRNWDGRPQDVLLAQRHDPASDAAFIDSVIPHFRSPHYITLDGAPLLLVYRAPLLSDAPAVAAAWRRRCRDAGLPAPHLCAVETHGVGDPALLGFDSVVEFPPHRLAEGLPPATVRDLDANFHGTIRDYGRAADLAEARPVPAYRRYRGIMPGWDNTPRRGLAAKLFVDATPERYELWLHRMAAQTLAVQPPAHRLMFVNAWNEWGEGAHLEPDGTFGAAFLDATRRVLRAPGAEEPASASAAPPQAAAPVAARQA